ncbi:YebC/PmpR family DNA-binding transcriptional regulator [Candidatus Ruthturnera calyptogenae]|uniref:YebC/PmpR family DNA-binding transcriptional regulator n=1 Tax=Candidatus Ruthturnera calyptogenae TaxID=386487 RepID=UPI0004656A3F|nr:YebC/PmpR family DNA-binding transcriptional regulator [Candidatus Ruthturnera calyptogenae]
MAGHSKWHNIQHRKGAQDAKRGKIFTKLIKEIVISAKIGGGRIENNHSLKIIIDKALAVNMRRNTIENAVKRGNGDFDGNNYEKIRYEGYSLGGTAIMVDCLSDNRNRTISDIRHAFLKHGGNLGRDGSVSYLFTKQGFISFDTGNENQIMEIALDEGAQDIITNDDDSIDVITTPEDLDETKKIYHNADISDKVMVRL